MANRWLDYDAQSGGVAAPGLGNISADPIFDASSSPPFALAFGSPCINAGDPSPVYNDHDGSRSDMGAFGGPSGSAGSRPARRRLISGSAARATSPAS